ncbi:MAG: hypothetical protein V2A78_02780 [bacterium]
MKKLSMIMKEIFYLIKRHKIYFLAPIFIILAILAFFVWDVGPYVIVSLIYAGF